MQTRFFAPHEIIRYFEQGKSEDDLLGIETMAICSSVDVLNVCELQKKGQINLTYSELQQRFQTFYENVVETGNVFVADLDQGNLSLALFERDVDEGIIDLWDEAIDRNISPKRSIRYLTLRLTDASTWWSEDVYHEMEDYHITQDD